MNCSRVILNYAIYDDYAKELEQKRTVFSTVAKTKSAVHLVMVTTDGLARNKYFGEVQNEVTLADLFV